MCNVFVYVLVYLFAFVVVSVCVYEYAFVCVFVCGLCVVVYAFASSHVYLCVQMYL